MKFTAWSFSRWGDYDKCPRFAKYRHLDKLPEVKGEALFRGGRVHKEAEDYLVAKRKPRKIPPALSYFTDDFAEIRRQRAAAEGRWGFDSDWSPVDYFGPTIWCRMILDAFVPRPKRSARVIDFKTGREYPSHDKQLELYALGAFSVDPALETVSAEMWYLDSGDSVELEFTRSANHEQLVDTWAGRVAPMLKDRKFEPTPSENSCRWCPHHAKKGGPCDAGV